MSTIKTLGGIYIDGVHRGTIIRAEGIFNNLEPMVASAKITYVTPAGEVEEVYTRDMNALNIQAVDQHGEIVYHLQSKS